MKTNTLSSPEVKNIVRAAVPTSKIFTAAVARLYVASPDPSKWTYALLWGAAVFCVDSAKNDSFFIRLVDIENNKGVIWEQELYQGFDYVKDAGFFHTFETDDYLAGLEFVDSNEADTFYKKVHGRGSLTTKSDTHKHVLPGIHNKKRSSKIDKNHIGMPADFRHVGHIGYTQGKGFSVQNNDPEKNSILDQLAALGISADEISENQAFIDQFLQQNNVSQPPSENSARPPQQYSGTPPPPPPPSNQKFNSPTPQQYSSPPPPPPVFQSSNSQRKKTPPPPPPPGRHHSVAPPPPPPRRPHNHAPPPPPSISPRNIASGPPVPNRGRPVPPPPPGRSNISPPMNSAPSTPLPPPMMGIPPPPPAPPPPPMMGGPPPPPPPPPPMMGGAPPPPPSGIPTLAPPGRTDLMASIRQAGGFGTLKQSGKLRKAEVVDHSAPAIPGAVTGATVGAAAAGAAAGSGGGDLASSLANVLKQRQQAMQSDDEDDDDDEWE